MLVLSLDTATPSPALAISGGGVEAEMPLPSGRQASEVLLPSLRELLAQCRIELTHLERLAVIAGPGSFTGIRVGLSTVWALARCLRLPVETIGSLEAVAETARGGGAAAIVSFFDAKRGEVYAGRYDLVGQRAREIEAPRLLSPGGVPELAGRGDALVSPTPSRSPSPALAAARAVARAPRERATALHAIYVRLSAAEERRGFSVS